jgi:uncharacterized membrane protein YsdA (DUF1294 family)/cold shock CspA family protein
MRLHSTLTSWNDDKGFGFIECAQGKFFAHISQFPKHSRRPVAGDKVSFSAGKDQQGRLQAQQIEFAGQWLPANKAGRALLIALAVIAILCCLAHIGHIQWFIVFWYAGLSLLTYVDYAFDKNAARQGSRRTPENRLHLLALFGGWPGALYARQALRHKSAKTSFTWVFYITVIINLAALAYWLYSKDARLIEWINLFISTQ